MKKIISLLFIFISLVFSNQAFSNDDLIQSLKEGGKIIFIRHAYAPGGGDPDNFDVKDCSTQRNLNNEGISQSKLIGDCLLYTSPSPRDRPLSRMPSSA